SPSSVVACARAAGVLRNKGGRPHIRCVEKRPLLLACRKPILVSCPTRSETKGTFFNRVKRPNWCHLIPLGIVARLARLLAAPNPGAYNLAREDDFDAAVLVTTLGGNVIAHGILLPQPLRR